MGYKKRFLNMVIERVCDFDPTVHVVGYVNAEDMNISFSTTFCVSVSFCAPEEFSGFMYLHSIQFYVPYHVVLAGDVERELSEQVIDVTKLILDKCLKLKGVYGDFKSS